METDRKTRTVTRQCAASVVVAIMVIAAPAPVASNQEVPAPVEKTGQVTCYGQLGEIVPCEGTGQDGEHRPGSAWPNPRFIIGGDGTVTDLMTRIVWLQDAGCLELDGTDEEGRTDWNGALAAAATLEDGVCGLSDDSEPGDWRLPNINELISLQHAEYRPAMSNTAGDGPWAEGDPFHGFLIDSGYWSSTTAPGIGWWASTMNVNWGGPGLADKETYRLLVWPVRLVSVAPASPQARVERTGQTTCYEQEGTAIPCEGTGQDGEYQDGVPWPRPRFVDNGDGTVYDALTGTVWLRDASCATLPGTDWRGWADWETALSAVRQLRDGMCGLSAGSVAGSWRLPTVKELWSLSHREYSYPALSNAEGTGQWIPGDPFVGVESGGGDTYWNSTSLTDVLTHAVQNYSMSVGRSLVIDKSSTHAIWPVRRAEEVIFSDGFESGDTSAWSGTVP